MKYLTIFFLILSLNSAFAAQADDYHLYGEVLSLQADTIEMRDADNKIFIVPKKLVRKGVKPKDLIHVNITRKQLETIKLKIKG